MFVIITLFLLLRASKSNPSWFLFPTSGLVCVCVCVLFIPSLLYSLLNNAFFNSKIFPIESPSLLFITENTEKPKQWDLVRLSLSWGGAVHAQPAALRSETRGAPHWAECQCRVKSRREELNLSGNKDGNFLGIWRKKRVIHTKLCIVLERATCVLKNWPRKIDLHGLAVHRSSHLLLQFWNAQVVKCLIKHVQIGLVGCKLIKKSSIHQLQRYLMTLLQ